MAAEKKIIRVNELADVYILPNANAVVTFKDEKRTTPIKKEFGTSNKILNWGTTTNSFPQEVEEDVRKVPALSTGLWWMAKALVSGGLVYGNVTNENGEEKLIPIYDKEIEDAFKRTNINRYCIEHALEFYKFWNTFTMFTKAKDRSKIAVLECMESAWCRVSKQDENTGAINKCYINANYTSGGNENSKETITKTLLDPYFDAVVKAKELKDDQFIYPVNGPSSGDVFYQRAPWDSIRQGEWLDVAKSIPKFKKNLLKKQYSIKYHFEISDLYWNFLFPDWDNMKPDEKETSKQTALQNLDDKFKGEEKAASNIITIAQTNPQTKEVYPGLRITAIDDKLKSGIYIEDSQEATYQIFLALGIDGTIIGPVPTSGNRSGSGSDKRVAYNIHIANCKPEADLILEPVQFFLDYNGFTEKYSTKSPFRVWFKNYWITTLDKGKETKQQSS